MLQWGHWAFGETVLTIPALAAHFTITLSINHIKIQEVPMTNQAILFDLDGTLLPMDNDRFTQGYFHLLAQAVAPYGYEEESLVSALWKGVGAMVRNQGLRPNCQVFWEIFSQILGPQVYDHIPVFDAFYAGEFQKAQSFTGPNPAAAQAVALARSKAERVILATNPLFPPAGVRTRLSWVGLQPEDFDWVTDYENSRACKPNPAYYLEILHRLHLEPSRCLMVGNDVQEDVEAAQAAGLETFLVTDCLINRGKLPDCAQGDFAALLQFLEAM